MSTSITATVTKSFSVAGATYQSGAIAITGEVCPIIEVNQLAAAATSTIPSITFAKAKLAALYFLTDQSDVTLTFTNAGGDTTIPLTKGVPYEWDSASGADNPLAHDCTTLTINNNGSQAVATDVHGRILLTA